MKRHNFLSGTIFMYLRFDAILKEGSHEKSHCSDARLLRCSFSLLVSAAEEERMSPNRKTRLVRVEGR